MDVLELCIDKKKKDETRVKDFKVAEPPGYGGGCL